MQKKPRPFLITVNNTASKFAKSLQTALQQKVAGPVLRSRKYREGRSFVVTPQGLNKIEQFERFSSVELQCPRHANSIEGAKGIDCKTLFARVLVNSTNGRGIVEFDSSDEEYPRAPLYTEYIPKKAEYRVHVFNGEVIDIQQKKKRKEFDGDRNTRVRNSANGYVYCRDGINPPDGIADLAISAVKACSYQYGAVDIIYNEKQDKCFVLEVNSRPGLMGTTLEKYANAIIKSYGLKEKV